MRPPIKQQVQNESGLIIVAFTLMVTTMLIFVGLAVDSGNLYLMRLRAQGAADAAALSGLGLSIDGRTNAEALAGARAAVVANLRANAVSDDRLKTAANRAIPFDIQNNSIVDGGPGVNASFQTVITAQQFVVEVNVETPLYILGAIPGGGFAANYMVRATGRAQLRPANIAVVLDTSDSMACPSVVNSGGTFACPCVADPGGCQQGAGSKIDSLKNAATLFVDNFNETRDSVSLTAYGHGAELVVPFRNLPGFRLQDINPAIQSLIARGATNTVDGLITAYWDARQKGRLQDIFYVHFSDGAPTAARFHFDGSIVTPRGVNPMYLTRRDFRNRLHNGQRVLTGSGSGAWNEYDWINWGIMLNGDTPLPGRLYQTPPVRRVTGFTRFWDKREFSGVAPSVPPAMIIGGETTGGNAVSQISEANPNYTFSGNITGTSANRILLNPIISLPTGRRVRLGRAESWGPAGYDWNSWIPTMEHSWFYHDVAIIWADFLREQEGIVYGIGYGRAAPMGLPSDAPEPPSGIDCGVYPVPVACSDPYQSVGSAHWRKDIFNRRLALSVCGWSDPPFLAVDIPTIQDELRTSTRQTGEYFAADDAETLRRAFEKISRKIKMKRASNVY